MVSVMTDPWKYIRGGDGAEELYDLRADRDERRNLVTTAPAAVLERVRAGGARTRH
jgi:arylsulfatase A-like enzyme